MTMRTGHSNILICQDDKAASREAAERFVCTAIRAVAERGTFLVAVSGGSSSKGLYELLSSRGYSELVPWTHTELFFADERCVPPESEESNYRMVHRLLLSTVPIPESNVHRFHGEDPPELAANAYEQEIHSVMGDSPCFDLIVLGMGADTHTASLFPFSPALKESGRHAVASYVETLGAYRLTLTVPLINHAESVIVLALGEAKATALATAVNGPIDTDAHPIQSIHPTHGRLLWIVDQAAASRL